MLNITLEEYKADFKNRLQNHLTEYGENSPASFLELDLSKYSNYRKVLSKILTELSGFNNEELKTKYFKAGLVYELKSFSQRAYDKAVLEEKKIYSRDENNDITGAQSRVKLDYKSIGNLLTSAHAIINFINHNFENIHDPSVPSNPYPRVFTNEKAFKIFKNLLSEFGITKSKLADYSYVYHKMLREGYIYNDYKQTEFVFFLLNFDINISRIKPWDDIGNKKLRDRIYLEVKDKSKTVS